MFKIFKKALSVTLSVTLLMSTILVGGMFSFSASAATDLSGTKMPLTYTFDFEEGTFADYTYQGAGEAYKDADGNDVVEYLYGSSVDQFGNTFYPLRTRANDKASAVYNNISVTTVGGATENRGVVTLDNTAQSLIGSQYGEHLMYIPTDVNGKPYIIEPNTNYKVTIKAFIENGDGVASVYIGGGAIHANSPKLVMGTSYRAYAGTAGAISPSSGVGFLPIYRAHDPDVAADHVYHKPLSSRADGGTNEWKLGSDVTSGGMGAHWQAFTTTEFKEAAKSTVSYQSFTLPMTTGDFTLNENGQFVLEAIDSDDRGAFSPYFAIAMTKNKMLIHFDSITIEKEVKVTLDANGGYFGEFDATNPTTTATAQGFAGAALSATPSHPDASTTFVGWSLDGVNVIDAETFSDAIAGRTLKAVWADESLTYTFDFDSVPEITTTASTHGSYSTDQYGNQFHPATLYEGGDVATHTVSKETINYNGEDLSTLKVYSSSNREFRIIPVDENGKPYIVEPNTTYTVSVKYYTKQNKGYGGFFVGGGATNIAGHATTGNWCWLTSFTTRMMFNGVVTDVTGKRPMFPAYSSSINDTAWRDRDGSAAVSFETKTMTFSTEDFTATNGKFTYGSFSDTGAYFVLYMGPYTYWQNSTQDTSNKQGPYEYYFDYITITKSVSDVTVNLDANGGSFGDAATTSATLTPGEAIEVTAPTQRGAKFVGWSWYKNGPVVDTATTGMAGKTLYAVWAPVGTAALNANGGYFGDYAAENATVTSFIYEGDKLSDYAPKYPDSSATLIGWDFEGEVIAADAVVTADMVGKTLYALWEEENNTYTFDFDEVKDFGLLTYDVPANASSVDQYGQTFYPFVSYSGATTTAGGNTVQYNGQTITTLKIAGINHSMLRYIPTDADGLPYIVKPNTKYKVDVTYYTDNWYPTDNIYFGAGASNAYSSNIKQGNWCWLTSAASTLVRYYPDGTSETGNLNSFDEWGYHPESIGMVTTGKGVAYTSDGASEATPIYNTESVYFTTSDFTQAADGSYTWTWGDGSTWKTAPYFCFSYGESYATENKGKPRDFQIDKIVITEVKDAVTVNFDANGGTLDSTSATLTPGDAIEVEPTHSDASYQFVGWSWYKDTFVPATVATTGMDGATLYAFYEQMVPVTFNANGGTLIGQESITQYYYVGNEITIPATPEKKFHAFKGWAEAADSNVVVDIPATATLDLVGKTYYAVWEAVAHGDEYDTFTRVVDYSTYTVKDAINTWHNESTKVPYFSVVPDANATGGKYLNYDNTTAANSPGSWAANWNLTMTNSGDVDATAGSDNNLALPAGTTYKVTLRARVNVFDGDGVMYVCYGKSNAFNAYDNQNKTTILTGIPKTNGEWVNIVAYFTTPAAYTGDYNRAFIGIMPTANGGAANFDIDTITLERVTATTLYIVEDGVATEAKTVYGVPGNDLVLPTEVSKENYAANGTATVSRTPVTGWFADSALETAAVTKFANFNVNIYGKVEGETTTTSAINQNLFCGFDSYAKAGSAAAFITDEEAYTGNFSAKAANLTDIEVRNTNDLMLKAGKTYKVSFSYKRIDAADDTAVIAVGISNGTSFYGNETELALGGEWMNASAIITADKGFNDGYNLVLRAKGVYIDNVVVSSVADVIGAFTDDDTNIRFMMGYTLTGDKIVIEGAEYTIVERGINIMGEGSTEAVLTFKRDADLTANCWSYDEATGKLVFSANIIRDESFEGNKVVAQGYVVLDDGTTFYTDYITASREDVTSVDMLVGDAFANDLYVYLPEGTVFAAETANTATFYNLFVSGAVEVADVLDNNTMKFGAYVKFSAAPAAGTITVPAASQYLMHSGTYDELCAGVDAHVATYKLDQVGEDAVNYIFITDLHFDNNNPEVTKQVELITNMANNDDSIDMVVVGGDITTGMFATKEEAIAATQTAIAPLKDCTKPVIVLRGNHDDNTYGGTFDRNNPASTIVSDLDWEMEINRFVNDESVYSNFVHNSVLPNSAYYYFDIEKNGKATRVIALNACDQDLAYDENGYIASLPVSVRSWEITDGLLTEGRNVTYGAGVSMYGYSSRQMKWLAEEALAGFDGDIIVLSHMATDGHGQGNASVTPVKNSEALTKILNAYQTKVTYSGTLYDELADVYNLETREYTARAGLRVAADFSDTDGKVLIYQYGHTHIEMMTYYAAANIWEINTATANYVNAPKDYDAQLNKMNKNYPWNIATLDQRTANNDAACFDVVSAGSNVVYKFNVGFGEDATMVIPR